MKVTNQYLRHFNPQNLYTIWRKAYASVGPMKRGATPYSHEMDHQMSILLTEKAKKAGAPKPKVTAMDWANYRKWAFITDVDGHRWIYRKTEDLVRARRKHWVQAQGVDYSDGDYTQLDIDKLPKDLREWAKSRARTSKMVNQARKREREGAAEVVKGVIRLPQRETKVEIPAAVQEVLDIEDVLYEPVRVHDGNDTYTVMDFVGKDGKRFRTASKDLIAQGPLS